MPTVRIRTKTGHHDIDVDSVSYIRVDGKRWIEAPESAFRRKATVLASLSSQLSASAFVAAIEEALLSNHIAGQHAAVAEMKRGDGIVEGAL